MVRGSGGADERGAAVLGAPTRVLSLADGRPLDLLELGPSAGLNLLWDRYAYRYSSGTWGSGQLELAGNDRIPPPAGLLERRVEVVRRRGVDLSPVDITTAEGSRVLQAFVWPDQEKRLERLRRAIEVARDRPSGADPRRLRHRAAVTVARSGQRRAARRLPDRVDDVSRPPGAERLRAALHEAGGEEPLVFVTTGRAPDDDGFSLEIERFPDGRPERVAVFDFHGEWLDWGR